MLDAGPRGAAGAPTLPGVGAPDLLDDLDREGAPSRSPLATRRWGLLLAAVVALGLVLRVAYVLVVLDPVEPGLDAIWYQLQGGSIRQGTGFVVPTSLFEPVQVPTAGFPPVYPAYQALWQWVFGAGPTSVRLAGIVPGAATIALTGWLGRRVAGARAGLLAAAVVAVDPTLLAVDGATMSENVTVPLVLAVVAVTHRLLHEGVRAGWVVALGVLCGVGALARQDLLLLVALVAGALVWWDGGAGRARRLGTAAVVVGLSAAVVLPWAVRNERAVGAFTVSTLSPSSVLAGANCDETYAGPGLGSWSYPCVARAIPGGTPREVEVADAQQRAAVDHVRDHLGRLPVVLAARQARVWAFWDPRDLARRDADESRRYGWQLASRPLDAALAVAGLAGLVRLVTTIRRHPAARTGRSGRSGRSGRWRVPPDLVLLVPILLVAVTASVSYGNPRFNAIAHPVLAVGLAVLVERLIAGRRPSPPPSPSGAGSG